MSEDKLNVNNYLNIVGFALSWVLNSDIVRGPGAEDGNVIFNGIGELFQSYESIVMPVSQTYLIAHMILLLEGVFAITQLLPKFRGSIMVQECVKHWFFLSALMQLVWSIAIGFQNVFASILSVLFMGTMFMSITKILMSQAATTDSSQTPEEFWLLRFPFSMHFAWALAVFSMSINGFFVQQGFGTTFQIVLGIITILTFAGVGYKILFKNGPHPNYIIPVVLSWFLFGIAICEQGPKVDLEGLQHIIFDSIAGVTGGALAISTSYIFYKTEVDGKNSDLSKEINDVGDNDDTVYVTAPDGGQGQMA